MMMVIALETEPPDQAAALEGYMTAQDIAIANVGYKYG